MTNTDLSAPTRRVTPRQTKPMLPVCVNQMKTLLQAEGDISHAKFD
jgi:hypothetical protein